jgi:hypothetical protein
MALATSSVYKCLEKKTLILGFEVLDLFALCILMCALNLVFANADFKILYTWIPTGLAALGLRAAKLGKPENFLLHWVRYHLSPGVFKAFVPAATGNALFQLKKKRRGS